MGAWIETVLIGLGYSLAMSHPSWVRGLKRLYKVIGALVLPVAPLVGAWIETDEEYEKRKREKSHPSWVRGLKLY